MATIPGEFNLDTPLYLEISYGHDSTSRTINIGPDAYNGK